MTRQRAFQTAAYRRRQNPIVWIVDEEEIKLRASVDLAEVAEAVETISAPIPEGESDIKVAAERRKVLVDVLRHFVEPTSVKGLDKVADDLDWMVLTEMLQELVAEYTGQANPTQEQSSSDGSLGTGSPSTDTAPQEVSKQ